MFLLFTNYHINCCYAENIRKRVLSAGTVYIKIEVQVELPKRHTEGKYAN